MRVHVSRRAVVTAMVAAVLGWASATPAAADRPDGPNLTSETFSAGNTNPDRPGQVEIISSTCNDEVAIVVFEATGPATGPFTGTFEETVRIVAGAPDAEGRRQVRSITAQFEISSTAGEVRGTKRFVQAPSGFFCESRNLIAGATAAVLRYHATIHRPQGTYTDSGFAGVEFIDLLDPRETVYAEQFFLSCDEAAEC